MNKEKKRYLSILSRQYPSIMSASTEIINLQAILSLPKGTEHFLTDIHGEYEQFNHVLKNGSGSVRRKIQEVFGNTLTTKDKKELATIIYYPKEKLDLIKKEMKPGEDWYLTVLHRLVQVTKRVSSKYTRSKVRKAIPAEYAYVIDELITERAEIQDKEAYYNQILKTIVSIGEAEGFIKAISGLITRLVIDHLHIVGDIYDRGPGPQIIMEMLMHYHSVDIQWGNHDIVWMGAACGHQACIANVLRMCAKYGHLDTVEDGYGINLVPLVMFAMNTYKQMDDSLYTVKGYENNPGEAEIIRKVYKAISVIQFKIEGQLIMQHPEFYMENRLLLDRIDYEKGEVDIDGVKYKMRDVDLPTIDQKHPYKLSKEEEALMERLSSAFLRSEKLKKHVNFLYCKGSLYKISNSNLLYHGCIPMDEKGNFLSVSIDGKDYSGRALYDILEKYARIAFYGREGSAERKKGGDLLWYLWEGPNSPAFGKDKMTTFERIYIEDKAAHKEKKNSYYQMLDNEEVLDKVLTEFGLPTEKSHIVNGHVPVEQKKGESPIKCNGKLLAIDGGFSKAYHGKTGIAGYTLISNSYGMRLVAHEDFESAEAAIRNETDIVSDSYTVEKFSTRMYVGDTDIGKKLKESIKELEELRHAYENGEVLQQ